MTWLALRALLARVPGIVWVIAFVLSLAVAGWFAAVHIGERRGEATVRRAAVADSVVYVREKKQAARAASDSVVRVATKAKVASDSGRVVTRAVIEAHLRETPPEVVQAVNAQLARDSITIAVHVAAQDTLLAERPIVDELDSLRVHQVAIGIPAPDQHRTRYLVGGALIGAGLVITIFHFLR